MARVSTKENKNVYWQAREAMGLSREAASEVLETIPPERIERIENEKFLPHPDEVLLMAERYKAPMLCNYYCSQQCPIGREYLKHLSPVTGTPKQIPIAEQLHSPLQKLATTAELAD